MLKLDKELLIKNINDIAGYDFDNNKVFGSAYYVFQRNNLNVVRCFGCCSAEESPAVTEHTAFRLASMTKPVTAAAVLILIDKGLVSENDCIADYIPEFSDIHIIDADGIDRGNPVRLPSIRDLLTHSSGIGSDISKINAMTAKDYETLDASVDYLIKTGLDFEPGFMQQYSPTGAFDVAVKIIERVTGENYPDFLKRELFVPCEMYDTAFVPDEELNKRIIDMHCNINSRNAVKKMPGDCVFENVPASHYLGGGGLVSTLEDYGKFAKMLLNKGKSEAGKRIISEKVFDKMSCPYIAISDNQQWGLGVRVITQNTYPHLPVGSFGWSGAYGTHFWVDPENDIAAVFMKNSAVDGGAGNESAVKFEEAVYSSGEK